MESENCTIKTCGKPHPLLNPGSLSELHSKCKAILPKWQEGSQLTYQNFSKQPHTFCLDAILSHLRPSGIRLAYSYSKNINEVMSKSPFVYIDFNPRSLCSNICSQYYPIPSVRLKWKFQTSPLLRDMTKGTIVSSDRHIRPSEKFQTTGCKPGENALSVDWLRESSTISFNFYNNETCLNSFRTVFSYLQNITENLALGAELMTKWEAGNNSDGYSCKGEGKMALAGRYTRDKSSIAATYSMDSADMDVTYWRQVNSHLQLGCSLVHNSDRQRSIGSLFYQWEFPDSVVRGSIDSDTSVGFTYDRFLRSAGERFGISLLYCIEKNRFLCGFNINLDSLNNRFENITSYVDSALK